MNELSIRNSPIGDDSSRAHALTPYGGKYEYLGIVLAHMSKQSADLESNLKQLMLIPIPSLCTHERVDICAIIQ